MKVRKIVQAIKFTKFKCDPEWQEQKNLILTIMSMLPLELEKYNAINSVCVEENVKKLCNAW